MVLGLMAFMAGGAHANWLVLHNGVVVEPDVTLSAKTHKDFTMLIPAQNLEILCKTIEADPTAPILLLEKSTIGHGHLIISACETFVKKVLSAGCKPIEPILVGGLTELILHNLKNYLLYKPLTGKPFTTIFFNPAKCALAEENEVTGSLVFECGKLEPANTFVNVDCKTHEVTHLMQQAPAALFPSHVFKFGLNPASLDGIVSTAIEGPALYKGDAWGGHI